MGSEYDNSYGWAFQQINRSITIWEGYELQYKDNNSSREDDRFNLRGRCEIKYSFTSAEGGVEFEPGVVLCRDVINSGTWEVFDVLKRTEHMVMCTPCSNTYVRPVRHQTEPCPLDSSSTSLDAMIDQAIQPGQGRIQGLQKGKKFLEALKQATHILYIS
jgi:hypothetical protein